MLRLALLLVLASPALADDLVPPGCEGVLAGPPGGSSVAGFLAARPAERLQAVGALRDWMAAGGLDGLPRDCATFWSGCLTVPDDRGAAVAQGYLTGREAMRDDDAAAGILAALGHYCLGDWSPGPGSGAKPPAQRP